MNMMMKMRFNDYDNDDNDDDDIDQSFGDGRLSWIIMTFIISSNSSVWCLG